MRVTRFNPWSGRIPHATEQLGPGATITEATLQSPRTAATTPARSGASEPQLQQTVLHNKTRPHSEKPEHQDETAALAHHNQRKPTQRKIQRNQK